MGARDIHHPAAADIDLATVLQALGDPVRLAVARMLTDGRERTCTQLREAMDTPASTLSYHLRLLREAGVTRSRAEGTERHVSLRADDLEERFPGLLGLLETEPVEAVSGRRRPRISGAGLSLRRGGSPRR